jgi:hypothetical protein
MESVLLPYPDSLNFQRNKKTDQVLAWKVYSFGRNGFLRE